MRGAVILVLVALTGCLDAPRPLVEQDSFIQPPALEPILPATMEAPMAPSSSYDASRDLQIQTEGFRAVRLSYGQELSVRAINFTPADGARPTGDRWVALVPVEAPTIECETPRGSVRFHWDGTDFGNLVGAAVPAGDYVLLVYTSKVLTVTVDLGAVGLTDPLDLPTEDSPFGLRIVKAEPRQRTISVSTRVLFEQPFAVNGSSFFISQFTVSANTYQGTQRLESELRVGDDVCGGTNLERSGAFPNGSWTAPLNRTLTAGNVTWVGNFEARAAANPRGSAYAYLIEWPLTA